MMTSDQYRAANRFGLGAGQRDVLAMGDDPAGWLIEQLSPRTGATGPSVAHSRSTLLASQRARRERRKAQRDNQGAQSQKEQRAYRRRARQVISEQTAARFEYAVTTALPFRERLVHFWSNHFTVSRQGRPQISDSCVAYETETVRASLDEHFADMLVNVVSHPVMLIYLDNIQSIGPKSQVGRRRDAGLNENLAREVLELHTLGVGGGYTQEDVMSLAKILTGWTVGNERLQRFGVTPGDFAFVPAMHEPGRFSLLGKQYSANGSEQGRQALRNLARHPATAQHLATKLVRHFVADDPPQKAIDQIASVFASTEGHLPSVHGALVALPAAWRSPARKLKSPHDYLVSAYRGLDLPLPGRPDSYLGPLGIMNHIPFSAPSPAGWPDEQAYWGSPNALKQRIEWGIAMGQRLGNVRMQAALEWVLPPGESEMLLTSIRRAASPAQALSLLLASPDFQWR